MPFFSPFVIKKNLLVTLKKKDYKGKLVIPEYVTEIMDLVCAI